jgi:low temperature requirement protein LtrA
VSEPRAELERPVGPLELFFDLVFVFGFTQVTTLLSHDPTWTGLAHALLVLAALWWAWASYAWLTNVVDPNDGLILAAVLVATGAMFIAALAVPGAFGGDGAVFGVAFLIVSLMQAALYVTAAKGDDELLGALARVAPRVVGGALLILAAGFVGSPLRAILWVVALAVGFLSPALVSLRGWHVHPAHFVERHGLIVIIAIGEALVAVGVGARGIPLDAKTILAAVLGLVVATSFWLAYFDFFQIRGLQLLTGRSGDERIALARDVFTYLHLPMVTGIVLFAFATKVTLAHLDRRLGSVAALSLCGGSALYLFSYVVLRYRISRRLGTGRPTAAVACAALIPVARVVPAIVALGLLAAVWVGLHAYELIQFREARTETRSAQPV